MIVFVTPIEVRDLLSFLTEAAYLKMPKRWSAALARLRDDIRRGQVNSQRFQHCQPILRSVHGTFRTIQARTLRWSQIERWMRWMILPALLKYLFRVWPAKRRYGRQLDRVAQHLNSLSARCALTSVDKEEQT